MKRKSVLVDPRDMYQIFMAATRYAYTRNNHLEPATTFEHIEHYLPIMEMADEHWALQTAKQTAEECIADELSIRFYNGVDDEFKNRKLAIEFVRYLVDWICKHENGYKYMPYNYDYFVSMIGED